MPGNYIMMIEIDASGRTADGKFMLLPVPDATVSAQLDGLTAAIDAQCAKRAARLAAETTIAADRRVTRPGGST